MIHNYEFYYGYFFTAYLFFVSILVYGNIPETKGLNLRGGRRAISVH